MSKQQREADPELEEPAYLDEPSGWTWRQIADLAVRCVEEAVKRERREWERGVVYAPPEEKRGERNRRKLYGGDEDE